MTDGELNAAIKQAWEIVRATAKTEDSYANSVKHLSELQATQLQRAKVVPGPFDDIFKQ
jgi:hypothetical protein